MNRKTSNELWVNLKKLIEKPVWGIIAGEGTGSVLSLKFGEKIPRSKPLSNPHLTKDEQEFEGEYSLFIETVWRLDYPSEILAASYFDNSNHGAMKKGLEELRGRSVTSVLCLPPGFDLWINIDSVFSLHVFASDFGESDDFYTFFTPSKSYTIKKKSKISVKRLEKNK